MDNRLEALMTGRHIVGLDIGGANLKAAHVDGLAVSQSFPLWKKPAELPQALTHLLANFPQVDHLAVSMTGELADCFETKQAGVDVILSAVEQVASGRPVSVWQTAGEFVEPELAREFPRLVAAANWHALASWLGRMNPTGNALLFDIGSTTTDIIPIEQGCPVSQGLTDVERLASSELVYLGVRRSPLMMLAHAVPLRNQLVPLAAEYFASTLDLYLLSGDIPEAADNLETANGKPTNLPSGYGSCCRSLCCDRTELTLEEINSIVIFLRQQHLDSLKQAVTQVLSRFDSPLNTVYLSGEGRFLAERLIETLPEFSQSAHIELDRLFTPEISAAACAYAVAQLAQSLA
ncbi:MAG: hydantoinase/oxoprolinase family protein [Planctomycetaceae bacterium]